MTMKFGEPRPAFVEPKPRMTDAQRDKLWDLCGRYNVPFREDDYFLNPPDAIMMAGWVEGWVGGSEHRHKELKTIYVGVAPNGDSHS